MSYMNNIVFSHVNKEELIAVLKWLKSSSPRYDSIPMRVYKENVYIFADTISVICIECLSQGIFPVHYKL